MRIRVRAFLPLLVWALSLPVLAQTPNTAALLVVVVDQTGAVVTDATVTVINNATGATREVTSGGDGRAAIAALSLTGTYKIGRAHV